MTPTALRSARVGLGLSAANLAPAMSHPSGETPPVHWTTIYRWERGENPIPYLVSRAVEEMITKAVKS